MEKEVTEQNGIVYVTLKGQLSIMEVSSFRELLMSYIEKGTRRFVIDMNQVSFIDSAGLGVLVSVQKKAKQNGGDLSLKGIKGTVKEVFEITRLVRAFDII